MHLQNVYKYNFFNIYNKYTSIYSYTYVLCNKKQCWNIQQHCHFMFTLMKLKREIKLYIKL